VKACGGVEEELRSLSYAVGGDVWAALRPVRLYPWTGPPVLILLSAGWELMPGVGQVLLIRRSRVLVTIPTELSGLQNKPRISKQSTVYRYSSNCRE